MYGDCSRVLKHWPTAVCSTRRRNILHKMIHYQFLADASDTWASVAVYQSVGSIAACTNLKSVASTRHNWPR